MLNNDSSSSTSEDSNIIPDPTTSNDMELVDDISNTENIQNLGKSKDKEIIDNNSDKNSDNNENLDKFIHST